MFINEVTLICSSSVNTTKGSFWENGRNFSFAKINLREIYLKF